MTSIMGLSWIILILSLLALLGIGYLANLKVVQCADGESGFLLAGRSLGPWVGGGTIIATGFSGWGFMGAPGVAYAYGATELLGNFFFGFSLVISVLFFARFLYRKGVQMGALTIPEFIARSHPGSVHSQRLLQGISGTITAIMLSVFLIGQVKALGILGGSWLNIPSEWAALLLMVVIIGYTCMGGMAAVAWTDTFMVLCMAFASVYMLNNFYGSLIATTAGLTE